MFLSKAAFIVSVAIFGSAQVKAQCPSNDNGQCKYNQFVVFDHTITITRHSLPAPSPPQLSKIVGDYEPVNPYTCGADSCPYENRCLASAAGFDVDTECCQAPQPSVCGMDFDPQICGTMQCSYSNMCIANLAGYTDDQCESPPPECPAGTGGCSGEPSNPYTCGPNRCPYDTICELEDAGWEIEDCCQDVRADGPCTADESPVSCGAPGGKQCAYSNQCNADASGYNENQCCPVAGGDTVCTMVSSMCTA